MEKQDILVNLRNARSNLNNARKELSNAQKILNESITFNNEGFKDSDIEAIKNKIDNQVYNLNNKVIPGVENM